jgi:hypothetical protein
VRWPGRLLPSIQVDFGHLLNLFSFLASYRCARSALHRVVAPSSPDTGAFGRDSGELCSVDSCCPPAADAGPTGSFPGRQALHERQVGECGPRPLGNDTSYVLEVFFPDQRNLKVDISHYSGPGVYETSAANPAHPDAPAVAITYYEPPVIGTDTETQSTFFGGTGLIQINQGGKSGTIFASRGGEVTVRGSWQCA